MTLISWMLVSKSTNCVRSLGSNRIRLSMSTFPTTSMLASKSSTPTSQMPTMPDVSPTPPLLRPYRSMTPSLTTPVPPIELLRRIQRQRDRLTSLLPQYRLPRQQPSTPTQTQTQTCPQPQSTSTTPYETSIKSSAAGFTTSSPASVPIHHTLSLDNLTVAGRPTQLATRPPSPKPFTFSHGPARSPLVQLEPFSLEGSDTSSCISTFSMSQYTPAVLNGPAENGAEATFLESDSSRASSQIRRPRTELGMVASNVIRVHPKLRHTRHRSSRQPAPASTTSGGDVSLQASSTRSRPRSSSVRLETRFPKPRAPNQNPDADLRRDALRDGHGAGAQPDLSRFTGALSNREPKAEVAVPNSTARRELKSALEFRNGLRDTIRAVVANSEREQREQVSIRPPVPTLSSSSSSSSAAARKPPLPAVVRKPAVGATSSTSGTGPSATAAPPPTLTSPESLRPAIAREADIAPYEPPNSTRVLQQRLSDLTLSFRADTVSSACLDTTAHTLNTGVVSIASDANHMEAVVSSARPNGCSGANSVDTNANYIATVPAPASAEVVAQDSTVPAIESHSQLTIRVQCESIAPSNVTKEPDQRNKENEAALSPPKETQRSVPPAPQSATARSQQNRQLVRVQSQKLLSSQAPAPRSAHPHARTNSWRPQSRLLSGRPTAASASRAHIQQRALSTDASGSAGSDGSTASGTGSGGNGGGSSEGRPNSVSQGTSVLRAMVDSDWEQMARLLTELRSGRVHKVVVMAGAGVSTASGIPDFRSPVTGLYSQLGSNARSTTGVAANATSSIKEPGVEDKLDETALMREVARQLPFPEAVFDIDFFRENPEPFFQLSRVLYPSGRYRPTLGHYFMRLLHEKKRLLRVYTQNIDGLERMAGLPSDLLVEAHGTFASATCTACGRGYALDDIRLQMARGRVPYCANEDCAGVIKPDVVFFGENLPQSFGRYKLDMSSADCLLVMGTSLAVEPFASIAETIGSRHPRVLFNREAVGSFEAFPRTRDSLVLGDLQRALRAFVEALGWGADIEHLVESASHELDARIARERAALVAAISRADSSKGRSRDAPSKRKGGGGGARRGLHTSAFFQQQQPPRPQPTTTGRASNTRPASSSSDDSAESSDLEN